MSKEEALGLPFYDRSSVTVAKDLIGKTLVRKLESGEELSGIIVEVEAYGGSRDPASHAFRGMTKRNKAMFGNPGHAYVYFTYGFYYCLNFVTNPGGVGATAVLIRALEPKSGLEYMMEKRKTTVPSELASGPGKLCQALSIDKRLNGVPITTSEDPIFVLHSNENKKYTVKASARIGIRTAMGRKWRFYAAGNSFLSRTVPPRIVSQKET